MAAFTATVLPGGGGLGPAAAAGGSTLATSVSSVEVTPSAVVTATPDKTTIAVTAVVDGAFLASSTSSSDTQCRAVRSSGSITAYAFDRTMTVVSAGSGTLTVTATSGGTPVTLVSDGAGGYSGALPTRAGDGTATVTVTASASQTVTTTTTVSTLVFSATNTSCTGAAVSTTQVSSNVVEVTYTGSASGSDTYVVDLVAPTVTATFAGGGTPSAPTGGTISASVGVTGAVPGDAVEVSLDAYAGSHVALSTVGTAVFSGSSSDTIGNNGRANFASLGLPVPCDAPVGTYTLVATLSGLADASGSDFDAVGIIIGTFDVTPSVNLVGTTAVFGFVDVTGDGIADYTNLDASGFTAVKAKRAVNTSPGAFHATNLMKTTGQCNAQTEMDFAYPDGTGAATYDMTLTAPAGFEFVKTGQTFAKVYAGRLPAGTLFDFESPTLQLPGASTTGDVSALLGDPLWWEKTESASTVLRVRLDGLSSVPADGYVYLRVRMRYIGTSVPAANQAFPVVGTVHVDGFNAAPQPEDKTNTYLLVHAPTAP